MGEFMTDSSVLADPVDNAPAGDAFYTPPSPVPQGDRGEPIYQRRLANDAVAALDDGENWLVLYRSQDAHGNAVATSGIIAVPRTEPPAGGFPVVSWAHGTVGVADLCAPSRDQPNSQAHPMNVYVQTLLNAFGATHTRSACPKPPVSCPSSAPPGACSAPGSHFGSRSWATPKEAKPLCSPPPTPPPGTTLIWSAWPRSHQPTTFWGTCASARWQSPPR